MAEYNNVTTRKWAQIVIPEYDKSQNVTLEQLYHATDAFIIENLTVVNECIQAINKNMTYELVKNKSGIIKLHNSYLQSVKP